VVMNTRLPLRSIPTALRDQFAVGSGIVAVFCLRISKAVSLGNDIVAMPDIRGAHIKGPSIRGGCLHCTASLLSSHLVVRPVWVDSQSPRSLSFDRHWE